MSEIPIKAMKYDDANKDPHQFYPLIVPEAIIFPDGTNGKQAFDAVINDMSDVFSDQKTYEVGDYCIYNNVLYKFIAQKTAGAWDSLKASVTTIDAELKSLLNQINTLNSGCPVFTSLGTGTALLDKIKQYTTATLLSITSWTPATDGPVEVSNGIWSYFVICHPEQNYLYTKIYSSLSNTDGSILRSWVGAVSESGVIIWKEL